MSAAATTRAACLHCGTALGALDEPPFCCIGCRVVHGLLASQRLDRYYDLRGPRGTPVPEIKAHRDTKWLEPITERLGQSTSIVRVDLDIQGLHCSACVWLIDELFRRRAGAAHVVVNPSLGRAHLEVGPAFDLGAFVRDVEAFGYLFGPPLKSTQRRSSTVVTRMGICIAIAMNSMIFGVAIYAGLDQGPLYELFERINLALSFVCVLVGGSVFIRSAWQGLRHGVLHLDLPIALGIVLAFAGSLLAYTVHHRTGGVFVDTLNVFIALMLVGRFLQERVLEKNRLAMLQDDGVEGLLARRVRDGRVAIVRCTEVGAGDVLRIAPGDLVPLDARLLGSLPSSFSFDWINGESRPRDIGPGERVPAGSFLASERAVDVEATEAFAASPLLELLRAPVVREADAAMTTPWWRRLAKVYVGTVLAAATVGFLAWLLTTGDIGRSVEVATAVLIVTCPCAFGIAMPIAYDLVQAGLRRAGLFVRSGGFLDRAAAVRTVVFDKTGTLTTGALRVTDTAALAALDPADRSVLLTMATSSSHPKSLAVASALAGVALVRGEPREEAGRGVSMTTARGEYRLGAPDWAAAASPTAGDVAFTLDGRVLADVVTRERLRLDAASEVLALRARDLEVWLLSGDESGRVRQAAGIAGIPSDHAVGDASPEGKAEWLRAHDHRDLLMIGDGINDSLVVARAFASGTPAVDRPFMAARSDFYFVTPGLRPIRLALDAALALARVRRRNLAIAVAYNVLAVSLAYAGLMSPLVCAVLMPASSLTTIAVTTLSLNARSRLWRS